MKNLFPLSPVESSLHRFERCLTLAALTMALTGLYFSSTLLFTLA